MLHDLSQASYCLKKDTFIKDVGPNEIIIFNVISDHLLRFEGPVTHLIQRLNNPVPTKFSDLLLAIPNTVPDKNLAGLKKTLEVLIAMDFLDVHAA